VSLLIPKLSLFTLLVVILPLFSINAVADYVLSVDTLDFENVAVNSSSSQEIDVVLTTRMDDEAIYNTIFYDISASGDFSVSHNCPLETIVSTSCTINVTFNPASQGALTGSLSISLSQAIDLPSYQTATVELTGTGLSGEYSVDRTTVDFGNVGLTDSIATQQVTLSNSGNATINLTGMTTTSQLYQVTHDCAVELDPNQSCSIGVDINTDFLSAATTAQLTITGTSVQGRVTQVVDLNAATQWGELNLSQSQIRFPDTPVDSASPLQTITVSNQGNLALENLTVSLAGQFAQSHDCRGSLASDSSCTISVIASPTSAGDLLGSLEVTAQSGSQTQTRSVALAVHATLADLTTSATELIFTDITIDTTSDPQTLTLNNQGDNALAINGISVEGDFSLSGDCTEELPAGQSCDLQVVFVPQQEGTVSGALIIDTDLGSTRIALSGSTFTADDPADSPDEVAELTTSVTELSFSDSPVNGTSQPQSLTLSNSGSTALTINSIDIEGDFLLTDNCGTEIAAESNCDLEISFSPKSSGSATGALTINTSLGMSRIPLSGIAILEGVIYDDAAEITELLGSFTGGNPNLASTSEAIAESCSSGRVSNRMQQDCNDVITAASGGDADTTTAIKEITPESTGKASNVSRQGGETQLRNLGSRISALRAGTRGLSFKGLDWRIGGENFSIAWLQEAYRSELRKGGGASADNSLMDSKLGVFITGNIGSGSKDETELESGLDFSTYGLTLGVDYRVTNQFILGSAFGIIDTEAELSNDAGDLDTQGYSLSLYGTYYSAQDYFIDFSATYGNNDFDQKRHIAYQLDGITEVDQELTANYKGDMVSLFIGSGYDFSRYAWSFGPRLDLEYIRSNVDEFTEESADPSANGSGWATRVETIDQTWLTLNLGGRVSYAHSADWGMLTPYVRLDWLHEFKDDSQTITAYFVDDPAGQAIHITTDNPDRDYLRLRLGASAQLQNGVVGFIDLGTLMAHSRWSSRNLSLGVRMEF
jgi:outer membrane autotransporter protein